MADNENYYELLRVHPQASAQEVKQAYRRLVNKYRYGRRAEELDADEMMRRLDAANEVLSDPAKRAAYDQAHGFPGRLDNEDETERVTSELVPVRETAPLRRTQTEMPLTTSSFPERAVTNKIEAEPHTLRPNWDEAELAGFSRRCGAFLLDYILTLFIPALMLVAAVFLKRRMGETSFANALVLIGYLAALTVLLYNLIYSYVQYGQSFGKRFMGLRVVRMDNQPPTYQTAILRHLVGYPLSFLVLGVGVLWMFWDGRQQCWHDKLAKTVVIREP
jgi:uncharacterized RDD family membrane protein YckC